MLHHLQKLLTILLLTPLIGFSHPYISTPTASKSISISINIKNGADLPLTISTPINGSFFIGQWHRTKTNESGNTLVSLPLDSSGICQIWISYLPYVIGRTKCLQIYAEPGGEYQITFEKENEFKSVEFACDNKRENELLNSFERYTVDFWGKSKYLKALMLKSSAKALHESIRQMELTDLKSINSFSKEYSLNETFLKVLREDVKYYYTLLFYTAWFVNEQKLDENENVRERAEWKRALKHNNENAEIDNPAALGSIWYNEYKQILWWWYYENTFGSVNNIPKNQPLFTYNAISKLFGKKVREQHLAYRIRSDAAKNKFSPKIQKWYKTFRKDYPSSPFLAPLDEQFKGVLEITNSKDSADIQIVSTINDVNELIKRFPNQMLYVDVWASWCGPCKIEFKEDNSALHKFFRKNNIRQIYITIDDSSKLSTCSDIIKFYSLAGDHFMANNSFYESLKRTLGSRQSFPIPRYFIVDRSGIIVEKNALRPSSKEELIKQLSVYLN
jgi:thiol-disulfide isomerase/thioredoxin